MVDLNETALGLLETRGLVAAIEAADAMLKAAEVRLLAKEETVPALITIEVVGEVAAVKAAVEAGKAAAERVGAVVSAHIIPRPDPSVYGVIVGNRKANTTPRPQKPASSGASKTTISAPAPQDLESMTVRELRAMAREIEDLPMQGREIARARKDELLALLQKHFDSGK
jgi:ethanolamine utilization protein EutM